MTRLKIKVRQLYGLTETAGLAAVPPGLESKINSSGCVAPNSEIVIKDLGTREILPPHRHGEICTKGPNVANGYFRNEEATKNAFDSDGYFLTGDVGYIDNDGHLFVIDRIKDLIKCKGFQVTPAELESILLQHVSVKDAAVVGIPDEYAGELPAAFVIRQPNADVTEEDLAKYVAERVSPYKKLTGGIKFIDEIPKNPAGKILRSILREKFEQKC